VSAPAPHYRDTALPGSQSITPSERAPWVTAVGDALEQSCASGGRAGFAAYDREFLALNPSFHRCLEAIRRKLERSTRLPPWIRLDGRVGRGSPSGGAETQSGTTTDPDGRGDGQVEGSRIDNHTSSRPPPTFPPAFPSPNDTHRSLALTTARGQGMGWGGRRRSG